MQTLFRAVVFIFLPTFVELALVSTLLWRKFTAKVALSVMACFALYVWWTIHMTAVSAVGEGYCCAWHQIIFLSAEPRKAGVLIHVSVSLRCVTIYLLN